MSLKTYHRLPSQELEVEDSIAAYCLDKAVMWFGVTVENLLMERDEVSGVQGKHSEPRYELSDLLDDDFRVPRPLPKPRKAKAADGLAAMWAMASQSGGMVKRWQAVRPS